MGILKHAMQQAVTVGDHFCYWDCPSCTHDNASELEIPEFSPTSDRPRDWASIDLILIDCENCDEEFEGTVTNSVIGVEFHIKGSDGKSIEIDAPDDFYLYQQYDQDYSDWLDFDASDDPFSEYIDSYHHISDLIADYNNHHSSEIVIRMVFVHHITALEAYLSDTLINYVLENKSAMIKLLKADDEIRKKKFTIEQIADKEDLVENEVKSYLRGIMYHNLSRVQFLYRATLGIDIFDLDISRAELEKAVEIRHHCVHRNGKDKEGKPLEILTRKYVDKIGELIRKLVEYTDNKLIEKLSDGKF